MRAEEVHAPHLLDVEVAQTLRRLVRQRIVEPSRARLALDDLADSQIIRHPHWPFLPMIWAVRDNVSAYDATYIMLAEAIAATLLTCDAKLASTPGHRARIELIR